MLKFIMRIYYKDRIYTTEPELFYELYKYPCGILTLLSLRKVLCAIIFYLIGSCLIFFLNPILIGLSFGISLILSCLQLIEVKKTIKFSYSGRKTPAEIRALRIEHFIRKIISMNGKALGKKEWKKIKQQDIYLYHDLLSDKCLHCCYFYSLEIAKIIKDSSLIWGAVEEPFEDGHNYYAHAVILRNGYIYDSNMRQSERYEDFIKLYKFKLYKSWNYDDYSQTNFRETERKDFRKWCRENNVLTYEKF